MKKECEKKWIEQKQRGKKAELADKMRNTGNTGENDKTHENGKDGTAMLAGTSC